MFGTRVNFWRWLGVEESNHDNAWVAVSNDSVDWVRVYRNTDTVDDCSWKQKEYDISMVADDQPTVYIRWTMGETSRYHRHCGWNIDDVSVLGFTGIDIPTDVASGGATPVLRIGSVAPNPFNPTTSIRFEIPRAGRATLAIYDVSGRLVTTLADERFEAGSHERIWRGTDASGREVGTGVYLARLRGMNAVSTQKLVLIR